MKFRTTGGSAFSRKNLWSATPYPLRWLASGLFGAVPQERLLGRRFREARAFIAAAQWWTTEQAREYQLHQLRALCATAYADSPHYRRSFDAAGFKPGDLRTLDDVPHLPFLDRQTIRENPEALLVVRASRLNVDCVSTSGTSGMPLRFYIGAERSPTEYAYLTSGWERAGYQLDQQMAVFKGEIVSSDRTGLRHEYDPIFRRHYYSAFHLGDADLRRYLDHIATLGPCYLLAYPSVVAALVRFLRRSMQPAPSNIKAIIAESEIVYPQQRVDAEAMFGCRYFSLYGLTEKVVAAAECEGSSMYHVWPTYGLFELIDENGHPVTEPGQRGEIVGTSFTNTVSPFIRYRTGDFATFVGDRCRACGRDHVLIDRIRGHRAQEFLVTSDRSLVPWSALNMHDDTFVRVDRFQFYQETPGVALLRIVPAGQFSAADSDRIVQSLARKLGDRITIQVQLVEALPVSSRGKAIYVDQRLEVEPEAARIA
jgi:phenylacetate-CoA ligase